MHKHLNYCAVHNILVITWDHEDVEVFKGKSIRFVPLWKWLQT